MSYYEHDIGRNSISVSYGVSLRSWSVPLEIGIGGSSVRERGFSLGVLCFWFAMHWWPREYPVASSTGDAYRDWEKKFDPESDIEYLLAGIDIEASELEHSMRRLRNTADLISKLRAKMPKASTA